VTDLPPEDPDVTGPGDADATWPGDADATRPVPPVPPADRAPGVPADEPTRAMPPVGPPGGPAEPVATETTVSDEPTEVERAWWRQWPVVGIALLLLVALIVGLLWWAQRDDDDDATPPPGPGTIPAVLATDAQFSTLLGLLDSTGLSTALGGTGPYTLFAPDDSAFAAVPADVLAALQADQALLTRVLQHHVAPGLHPTASLADGELPTLAGDVIVVSSQGTQVLADGVPVIRGDLPASNGVIHQVRAVLVPQDVLDAIAAATTTTTVEATTTTTVEATTTTEPPPTTTTTEPPPTTVPLPADLVALLAADERFTTLTRLVQEAGLVDELQGPGPFTLFAPTNEAFEALPPEELEALEADREALASVLLYHGVPGRLTAATLQPGPLPTLLEGLDVVIDKQGDVLTVNEIEIVEADLQADNGVVHVIESVLVPPQE
jgi:transforming growth factor-beta-induced protein